MRKINLFLLVSTIFISQYFFVGSVFAITAPWKKKTTTTTTTDTPVTVSEPLADTPAEKVTEKPSTWQKFKAKLPGRKPVSSVGPSVSTTPDAEPIASPPPAETKVSWEKRFEQVSKGVDAAQKAATAVLGTTTQAVETGVRIAELVKKKPAQPQQVVYPQQQYPYDVDQRQVVDPAASIPAPSLPPPPPAAAPVPVYREASVPMTPPTATPVPVAREVSEPRSIQIEPVTEVKEVVVAVKEEKVIEKVPERKPEELVAEFKNFTKAIIEYQSAAGKNNIEAIVMLADKAVASLEQIEKHLDDTEKQQSLNDIIEIFVGIKKIGIWAKDFGLTENTYVGLAKIKAAKAQTDYMQAFELEKFAGVPAEIEQK